MPAGLVVLRYLADAEAPAIRVSADTRESVRFLIGAASSAAGVVLEAGGPGIALQSAEGGYVTVSLEQAPAGTEAVVRLDIAAMMQGAEQAVPPSADPVFTGREARPQVDALPVDILAHVSRRGDVLVAGGGWVCGPDLPMTIEGFELRLGNAVPGLEIMSSAIVNLRGRKVTAPHPLGSFVGTRGRATPLLGVTFSLAGAQADRFILRGEALFLGAAIVARAGKRITLAGSGGEPLLGLRLSVERLPQAIAAPIRLPLEAAATFGPAGSAAPSSIPVPPTSESGSRVRVFRASRASAVSRTPSKPHTTDQGTLP